MPLRTEAAQEVAPQYLVCKAYAAARPEMCAVEAFMEWANSQGYFLEPTSRQCVTPPLATLLMEFHESDYRALEAERRAMIEAVSHG